MFISFVVFAEQRTTVNSMFYLIVTSFEKKLLDLTGSDKQSKFTHGEERPYLCWSRIDNCAFHEGYTLV